MRLLCASTCAALSLVGLLSPSAQAAAKGKCPFIADAAGDQTPVLGRTTSTDTSPGATSLDLRSADITADAKNLSVVIRVTSLRDADPVYVGHVYNFYFSAESTQFDLSANLSSDGNTFSLAAGPVTNTGDAAATGGLGDIGGFVDLAHNEIRMTVPRKLLSQNGGIGAVSNLKVYAGREVQTLEVHGPVLYAKHDGVVNNQDQATTTRGYIIGKRGCVPVTP